MSGILAQFDSLGATKKAIQRLRDEGHSDMDVYSPFPAPELEEALGIVASPVRQWALIGGVTGFLTAASLTGLTALAYPLVTQGKPLLSWPAYFVIMFEMTILFTGLFGFLGVLHHTRKPGRLSPQYRTTFSVDRFGVYVRAASGADQRGVEQLLREVGAVEVEVAV